MCLLATRGKPKRLNKSIPQLVVSERQEHSRKPDIIYEHIEKMLEEPYIELFARRKRMVGIVGEMKYDLGLDSIDILCYISL